MTQVSFFQRYSQRENHVTNNTLLLLKYFYEYDTRKLQSTLTELLENELPIGLSFGQQVRQEGSVPDGLIMQRGFQILIEAKLDANLTSEQVVAHVKGAKKQNDVDTVMLGLTSSPPSKGTIEKIEEQLKHTANTIFRAITYTDLIEALRNACDPHENRLLAIVDDYSSFLALEGLLFNPDDRLFAVPCGQSHKENKKYGVYYEPTTRPPQLDCGFLGIYHHKSIRALGKIQAVVEAEETSDGLVLSILKSTNIDLEKLKTKVQQVINETSYYDLASTPHRYYFTESVEKTNFAKISKGGMRGKRTFSLSEFSGGKIPNDARELSQILREKSFE
ncbi:hypothetical protein GUA87_00165 [Sneathiella sp. P13V-1]|uniref:hypothetical protein n=1 Tax=Sneathiella sp. P13V-1 TaxID=2697366 RepID=UPI00187BA2C8|nr:hypothetical protein [Sneathiella sp. P13V-1]MBE7635242.1 hypothetical protein [Sneathiella sp. P13V-1]